MPSQSDQQRTNASGNPYAPSSAIGEVSRVTGPASNVRFLVIGLGIAMSVLLYLDRFATTPATDTMLRELALTKDQFGNAVGAFFLAYALMQIPSGWITDTFGARWMLAVYVLCWSLATIGLGLAQGIAAIWTMRLILGVMQAGAYPTAAGLLKRWVPYSGRGLANSAVSMGGRCGLLFSLILTVPLMHVFADLRGDIQADNWRYVFVLYGSLGIIWALLFVWLYRDSPAAHPWTNAAEVDLIAGPLGGLKPPALAGERPPLMLLGGVYGALIAAILGVILGATWLSDFMKDNYGKRLEQLLDSSGGASALTSVIPQVGGLIGTLALCVLANAALRQLAPLTSRRVQLPFQAMAASKEVWLMCVINISVNIGWVFLATWLPQYLIETHGDYLTRYIGEQDLVATLITAVVGVAAMCGGLSGGRATDVFVRRFGHTWGRRLPGLSAGLLVCGMYLLVPNLTNVWLFTGGMIAIAFTIDFGLGATWASYQDIGGRNVAAILGVGNMCGNLGAAYFVRIIGQLADRDQWNTVFYLSSGAMLVAACCWMFFNAARPVVSEEAAQA